VAARSADGGAKTHRSRPSTASRSPSPSLRDREDWHTQILPVAEGHGEGDRREAVVEGPLARRQNQPNQPINNRIHILQHIRSGDAHHNKPLLPQPVIAQSIALRPVTPVMRHPVHLDDQTRVRCIEIGHITPHRMLPPKLHPARPQTQPLPQQHLRRRQSPPQPPRNFYSSLGSLPHPSSPNPILPVAERPWGGGSRKAADGEAKTRAPQPLHRLRRSPSPCLRHREDFRKRNHPGPNPQILPVAKRWGGGPLAQRVVEGRRLPDERHARKSKELRRSSREPLPNNAKGREADDSSG